MTVDELLAELHPSELRVLINAARISGYGDTAASSALPWRRVVAASRKPASICSPRPLSYGSPYRRSIRPLLWKRGSKRDLKPGIRKVKVKHLCLHSRRRPVHLRSSTHMIKRVFAPLLAALAFACSDAPEPVDAPTAPDMLETVFGANDSKSIACLNDPTKWAATSAVLRLGVPVSGAHAYYTGMYLRGGLIVTTTDAIPDLQASLGTQIQFGYERTTCGGTTNAAGWASTGGLDMYEHDTVNKVSFHRLITQNGGTLPPSSWRYLPLDWQSVPHVGDAIWIAQNGGLKVASVNDGSVPCTIASVTATQITYTCDTVSGALGSPVFSAATNQVIGMHILGGSTVNTAVRASVIHAVGCERLEGWGSPICNGGSGGSGGSGGAGGGGGPVPDNSCIGRCPGSQQAPAGCYCDAGCHQFGDCCPDRDQVCGG